MSPDRTKALVTRSPGGFKVWGARTHRLLADVPFVGAETYARWAGDSDIVEISGASSRIALFRLTTKKRTPDKGSFEFIPGTSEARSPDNRPIAIVAGETVEIRSRRSDRRLFTLDAKAEPSSPSTQPVRISGIRFSPDGRSLHVLYESGKFRTYQGDF